MNVNSIENELIIITKQTMDEFLRTDNPSDTMSLYMFYYYTAKWQATNQPKCTTGYASTGLKWSEARVRKAKKELIELGLIEDVQTKKQDGTIAGHYIKLYYIVKQSTLNHTVENAECGLRHSVDERETNALSAVNSNALIANTSNALSADSVNAIKSKRFTPPSVEDVRAYCEERQNNVDAERFVDYYSSKGWTVGRSKMKDWKAAVRNWERNSNQKQTDDGDPFIAFMQAETQRCRDKDVF